VFEIVAEVDVVAGATVLAWKRPYKMLLDKDFARGSLIWESSVGGASGRTSEPRTFLLEKTKLPIGSKKNVRR